MKKRTQFILMLLSAALYATSACGDEPLPGLDLSTKKDALRAIDQGIEWLKARQNADGSWPASPQPAVTAFATRAILRDPARERAKLDANAGKGLEFIASCAQKDGGICRDSALSNYSTAASLLALADLPAGPGSRQERYDPLILAARRFLVRAQNRRENSGQFGGWSNGDAPADLRTTALAIEALVATQRISTADAEKSQSAPADPDWAAAVAFLSRCQDANNGSFSTDPREAVRQKAAATSRGLAALIESNVARNDPRVLLALNWLRSNYALDDEAAGLGKQGLYFYYYSLADALSLCGAAPLARPGEPAASGSLARLDWRRDLIIKLISLQRTDEQGLGYWLNDAGDKAEKDPILVTAYCVLALETLVNGPSY